MSSRSSGTGSQGTVREILETLKAAGRSWSYATVATLLDRLESKGMVASDRSELAFVYRPLVTENEIQRKRVSNLVEKLYGGQPGQLVLHLLKSHPLDAAEASEVRSLLEEMTGSGESANPGSRPSRARSRPIRRRQADGTSVGPETGSVPPMPEDAAPVVVCQCGRRLNVRGARPGRVGNAPPADRPFACPRRALTTPSPPRPGKRPPTEGRLRDLPENHKDGPPGGYGLASVPLDDEQSSALVKGPPPPPSNPERLGDPKKPRKPIEAVGRGGILPLPKRAEATPFGSLLYPLWDGYGLAWLMFLPPVMTVASLVVFGLIPIVLQGGVMALFGPVAFATFGAFVIFLGYTLLVLQSALLASAQGQEHHPGWPDFELGSLVMALVRWGVALGLAVGPSLYAARLYLGEVPETGPETSRLLVTVAIAATGAIYSMIALVAVCLFDSLMAASPLIVIPALLRMNVTYVAPVVFCYALAEGVTFSVRALYQAPGFGVLVLATWLVWVGGLYGAIVLMRLLGRAYYLKARQIGWFPDVRQRREPPREPALREPIPEL